MEQLETMYRVLVLYMLDRLEYPLTNTQITNFILEKDYTDYFTVQQIISDLLSSELIFAESTHSNTRYHITESGRNTLRFFSDKLSAGIKEDIASYFDEHHFELKEETSVYADFCKSTDGGYQTRCQIKNGDQPLLDLTLRVSTPEQAKAICAGWKKDHIEVYALLMDILIK